MRASAGVIESDRRCPGCGYSWRGLRRGHACPECGMPISDFESLDDPMSLMPLHLIRRFRTGSWIATVCLVLMYGLGWLDLNGVLATGWFATLLTGVSLVWFAAIWMITPGINLPQAARHGFAVRGRFRLIVRFAQLSVIAYAALRTVRPLVPSGPTAMYARLDLALLTAGLLALASLVLLSILLARLATWARDDTAERAFEWFAWGVPALLILLRVGEALPVLIVMTFVLLACLPVVLLLLPGGLISLSRSLSYSILHALDHEDREERRQRRARRDADRIARRLQSADPPSGSPRRGPPRSPR